MDIVGKNEVERKGQISVVSGRERPSWVGSPQQVEGPTTEDQWVETVTEWLRAFLEEGQIVELRALRVGNGSDRTYSGFYEIGYLKEMAGEAFGLTFDAEGVYFTLNPLNRDLLSRRRNRAYVAGEGCACDRDVLRRRWLLIDVDAVRTSGVSASDVERTLAWDLVTQVKEELRQTGWPDPIVADSGNGYHLLYRVDQLADDGGLIKRALQALALRFDTDKVKIDQKVFNPARIVKLYGTLARKGDSTTERPHRWSGVLEIPSKVEVVPHLLLEELAAKVAVPNTTVASRQARPTREFSFGLQVVRERVRAYLQQVPPAVSGQGGHDATFFVACTLVLGFDLSVDDALPLMKKWNETCQPPWSDKDLLHKLRDANRKTDERGYLLGSGREGPRDAGVPLGGEVTGSTANGPLLAEDDPHRLAGLIKREQSSQGVSTLRRWRGQWWRWVEGAFALLSEDELRGEVYSTVRAEFDRLNLSQQQERAAAAAKGKQFRGGEPRAQKVTPGLVTSVSEALASLTIVPSLTAMPSWLGDEGDGSREWIAMKNGILELDRLLGGGANVMRDHSPQWFSAVKLPYGFDPTADCPKWTAFLQKNLEGDTQRIALLQEWFGYCLLPDTSQQKFLLLQGEGSNGKSVVCAVLTALLGEANVSNVPLESFGQRFALYSTINRLANVASEVGELDRVAEGALKMFTSGDRMTIDRKGIDAIEVAPTARLVLATNNLPRFSDRSSGIWRRMLLVPFRVEITQEERVVGMDKPAWWLDNDELPGVFSWAVEGLKRLRQQERFTKPAVCEQALEQYRTENNPARTFLQEHCVPRAGEQTVSEYLYAGYSQWCKDNGCQPLGSAAFGKEVKRAFPNAEKRKLGGRLDRHNAYEGIAYVPPARSLWLST